MRPTTAANTDPAHAGQAIYSPTTLAFYDLVVLGVSNRFIWRCPTRDILALYDRHVSDEHLDIGVGTGWYLDKCRFRSDRPNLSLMDLNASSLAAASRRVARYRPQSYQADVLQPWPFEACRFRSVAMTYLLHCLPGTMESKMVAFDTVRPLLHPDGVVFGATLLSSGAKHSAAARSLMRLYNRKGVFSNRDDTAEALRAGLEKRFSQVKIEIVGCGALFTAHGPL